MENNKIILYQTEDGVTKINVTLEGDTVWLTQAQMAELFQTTKQNVSLHISNIFRERELDENQVVKDFLTTALDGKNYHTKDELSPVEVDFLETIKNKQKQIEKRKNN